MSVTYSIVFCKYSIDINPPDGNIQVVLSAGGTSSLGYSVSGGLMVYLHALQSAYTAGGQTGLQNMIASIVNQLAATNFGSVANAIAAGFPPITTSYPPITVTPESNHSAGDVLINGQTIQSICGTWTQ